MGNNQNGIGQNNNMNIPVTPVQGGDYNSMQPTNPQNGNMVGSVGSINPMGDTNSNNGMTLNSEAQQAVSLSGDPETMQEQIEAEAKEKSTTIEETPVSSNPTNLNQPLGQANTSPQTPMEDAVVSSPFAPAQQPVSSDTTSTISQEGTTAPEQSQGMGNGLGDFSTQQTPITPAVEAEAPATPTITQPLNEVQTAVEQVPAQPVEQPVAQSVEQPVSQPVKQPAEQAPSESIELTEPKEVGQQAAMYEEKDEINTLNEPGPKGQKSGKGGTAVLIVLIVVIVALLATIGYFVYQLFLS